MTRGVIRLPNDGPRLFEVVSYGRAGSQMPGRFSRAQIDQISRTVRRIPEVMVKVTGGGTRRGAVAAHFAYISRRGSLEIETDEGERIGRREEQQRLIDDWHLELTAGQYRRQIDGGPARRPTKLVHNIVLSMPAPTPADKVLAAARQFARQKFTRVSSTFRGRPATPRDSRKHHSIFCTCSRICSISTLMSTAAREVSIS